MWVLLQEGSDCSGLVRAGAVRDAVCGSSPVGVWRTRSSEESTKFSERVESVSEPAIPPSWTSRAAKRTAVPFSLARLLIDGV
jgi:hypothetical protein